MNAYRSGLAALMVTSFAVTADASESMSFKIVHNAAEERWIAAEGVIAPDSPGKFIDFVEAAGPNQLAGLIAHLDSKGGDLAAAARLGDLFRLYGIGTTVSASQGSEQPDGTRLVDPSTTGAEGVCASACVLAFAGGDSRFASTDTDPRWISGRSVGRLEVHEFGFETGTGSTEAPGRAEEEAPTLPASPAFGMADVFSYLSRHGISAELSQIAMLVPATTSLPLTDGQIARLALDTGQPRSVTMRGYDNGVGIVEIELARPSGDYLLEIYCREDHLEILASVDWKLAMAADEFEGIGIFAGPRLMDHGAVKLEKIEHTETDDGQLSSKATLRLEGPLAELTVFRFEDTTGPEAARVARDLSFALPDSFSALRILPRVCL